MYIKRRLGPKQNEPCTKSISRFIFSQFNISVTPVRRENKTKAEEKQTKTAENTKGKILRAMVWGARAEGERG